MAKTIREAVAECIALHGHSDFLVCRLDDDLSLIHTGNRMRPDDYLDDMRWAEDRRARGYAPADRALLDMPLSAILEPS